MATADSLDESRYLPWIVLGSVGYVAVVCASLHFLPTYLLRDAMLLGAPGLAAVVVACLPRSPIKMALTRFVKRWLLCMSLYSLVVVACSLLVLLGCSAVGYLPYSDRPGPGWGNVPRHLPGLEEIGYFAGWALGFLLPACGLWGSVFYFFGAWLGWFGAPPWLIRVLGGFFCGFMALLVTAAAGWYIAIAAFVVNSAGVAGMLFGALILPRFAGPSGTRIAVWKRVALVSSAILVVGASVGYPLWRWW